MPLTTDFLPRREADLVAWASNFNSRLVAGGPGGAYGLTIEQVGEYTAAYTAFSTAWTAANQNSTRTPDAIQTKNDAKAALIAISREFAGYIQRNPATTNTERSTLQITVPDPEPTPVEVPNTAPIIIIEEANGTLVNIRLRDAANPDSRAKPQGVIGVTLLTAYGATPPDLADTDAWTFRGNVTRTLTAIDFTSAPSGTTAWITGFWFNTKAESGPPTQPVSVQIPGQFQAVSEAA